MNRTKIEWVRNPDGSQGYTWNPITGCLNGCEYCYARKLANGRLRERYLANLNTAPVTDIVPKIYKNLVDVYDDPFYPRFWRERIVEPVFRQKPAGIFPCDMSDLFGIGIPESWTKEVLWAIRMCPQHRFYLLTKQPQNLIKFSPFPENCWVGVTTCDAGMFNEALWQLSKIKASVKYISVEPLLKRIPQYVGGIKNCGIDWLIIGSQTKPYNPPKVEWVQAIVEAADRAGTPIFLKDNLLELVNYHSADTDFAFNQEGEYRQEMPKEG